MMHYTIQDLLDYAQIKADKFRKTITKFNIIDTVKKVIQMQQKQADAKNVKLALEFNDDLFSDTDINEEQSPEV